MMSKFKESRNDVFEVLQREPRHFGAISGLGMINLRLGDLNAALNAYKRLQRIFPASPEARQYIPILHEKLNLMDL
jgi:Flp pilus assembly protein TadD